MPYHTVELEGEEPHKLFYRLFGDEGTNGNSVKLLLTMGLGGDHYHWESQVEYFEKLEGFSICVYDNRGIGFSEPVSGRWTTQKMAQDSLSLLNFLGWTSKVHLVGLSMGGMITQELALLEPSRFASITLISTIAGGFRSLWYFLRSLPSGVRLMTQSFLSRDANTRIRSGLSVLYPDEFLALETYNEDKQEHEPNFRKFRRMLIRRGKQAKADGMPPVQLSSIIKQTLAVASHRVPPERLRILKAQLGPAVLVITGDNDILVHHNNSHHLREGLDAKLVVLEQAGHGANEQYADHVNQLIHENVLQGEALYHKSSSSKL